MDAKKFLVWSAKTPGAEDSVVASADTLAEARKMAEEFGRRRGDLAYGDVVIRDAVGRLLEYCGPCR